MTDHPGGPADEVAAAPHSLFVETVAALQGRGLLVRHDARAGRIELLEPPVGTAPVDGQVLSHQDAVVFYAVRDELVPAEHRHAVAVLTAAVNPQLYVSALELDLGTGVLAARAAVGLSGVSADRSTLGELLVAAAAAAARALQAVSPAVDAVLAGTDPELAGSRFAHDLLADGATDGVPAL